jgi:hypothetical protein
VVLETPIPQFLSPFIANLALALLKMEPTASSVAAASPSGAAQRRGVILVLGVRNRGDQEVDEGLRMVVEKLGPMMTGFSVMTVRLYIFFCLNSETREC